MGGWAGHWADGHSRRLGPGTRPDSGAGDDIISCARGGGRRRLLGLGGAVELRIK
jgi:hypothetical protein